MVLCPPKSPLAGRLAAEGLPFKNHRLAGEIDPGAPFFIRRLIREHKTDIIHCHDAHSVTSALLATARGKRPARIAARRVDFHLNTPAKYRLMDRVVAISRGVEKILCEDGIDPKKISLVPSGIDLGPSRRQYSDPRAELNIDLSAPLIGQVGSLVEHKDPGNFIKAAALIAKDHPEVRFVLVGDGPLRPVLEEEATRLKVPVYFTGHLADVFPLLSCFAIFVMSSKEEGLCTSILDAMSLKIPVAATTAGGIPDIVRSEETGLSAPTQDPKALAAAVCRLLDDSPLAQKLAQRARRMLEEEFSAEVMVAKTLALYRDLL